MADIKSLNTPLFLREEALRYSIELLFFVYRDFTAEADALLATHNLGRAHHRVLYFVGREPRMTISALLAILKVTKQSLARVLATLVDDGFITIEAGTSDKRQRLLCLTDKGYDLEARLTALQKARFAKAYKTAGIGCVDGFLTIMQQMVDADTRTQLSQSRTDD